MHSYLICCNCNNFTILIGWSTFFQKPPVAKYKKNEHISHIMYFLFVEAKIFSCQGVIVGILCCLLLINKGNVYQ